MESSHYIIDPARVVSETLEGETMLINMENGNYYSLNKTASVLWALVEAGRTQQDILTSFLSRYEGDADTITASVTKGIELFLNDRLVAESNEPLHSAAEDTVATKLPFEPLVIERHEDMQEMLLADPIHDVDASGWPTLKV
jgi:hypothetical protein